MVGLVGLVGLAVALLVTAPLAGCQAQPPAPAPAPAPVSPPPPAPTEAELPNRRAWWAVESATRDCMAEAGVEGYGLTPPWAAGEGPHTAEEWLAGREPAHRQHDAEALLGPRDGDDTGDGNGRADTHDLDHDELWRATGCLGQAFHETGTD